MIGGVARKQLVFFFFYENEIFIKQTRNYNNKTELASFEITSTKLEGPHRIKRPKKGILEGPRSKGMSSYISFSGNPMKVIVRNKPNCRLDIPDKTMKLGNRLLRLKRVND
jgi:hypothetical protein